MQRNEARLQMLTLALFALLGLLSLGLAPVQAVMDEYGLLDHEEAIAGENVAAEDSAPSEQPKRAPWVSTGPSLAVSGTPKPVSAPRSPCCGGELAIDAPTADGLGSWVETASAARPEFKPTKISVSALLAPADRLRWTSLDEATEGLGLSEGQRDAWTRTLDDARRELDDLRHVPNAEGRTWHTVACATYEGRGELHCAVKKAHALASFITSELNGGETYVEARRRLLDTYMDRLRSDLTPQQQVVFDVYDIDSLMDTSRFIIASRVLASPRRIQLQTLHVSKA